ncbi:MAG: radical SAM protein [Herbinix sp.]|nr:radical SAM protein [Herbinix sp.]
MNYTILGVMMHSECNAACDICSVSCSPQCKEELNVDRIKEIIESSINTSIKYVALTGGEPFLKYERVKDLVTYTKKCGLKASVVTNGFWADSYNDTLDTLKELKELGLERINISCDHHHLKYVKMQNINNILLASDKVGLPHVVAAVKTRGEKLGGLIDQFDENIFDLKLIVAPCQPVGRAKLSYSQEDFVTPVEPRNMTCPHGGTVTIYYDGNIYPCCSHHIFDSSLSIGHYLDLNMEQILYKIKNNSLLYVLRNYGIDPLLDMNPMVKEQLDEHVSCPCEVCAKLLSGNIGGYVADVNQFLKDKTIKAI